MYRKNDILSVQSTSRVKTLMELDYIPSYARTADIPHLKGRETYGNTHHSPTEGNMAKSWAENFKSFTCRIFYVHPTAPAHKIEKNHHTNSGSD